MGSQRVAHNLATEQEEEAWNSHLISTNLFLESWFDFYMKGRKRVKIKTKWEQNILPCMSTFYSEYVSGILGKAWEQQTAPVCLCWTTSLPSSTAFPNVGASGKDNANPTACIRRAASQENHAVASQQSPTVSHSPWQPPSGPEENLWSIYC